jgi:hypothetical protein
MHDATGRKLKVGDTVVIAATITQLSETEEFCNVSLETVLGRRPDGNKEHVYAINTGVLFKTNKDE